jgi:hypothetical protein
MPRLTSAQMNALADAERSGAPSLLFRVGEALRKRGLLDRLTTYVHRAEYVTRDSVTDQRWRDVVEHEWYITNAGREALRTGRYKLPRHAGVTRRAETPLGGSVRSEATNSTRSREAGGGDAEGGRRPYSTVNFARILRRFCVRRA